MPVARVVGYEVEQHPDVAPAGLGNEGIQVPLRAEVGMDRPVVGNVVAPIRVGRRHRRVQPDPVDSEPRKIVQPFDDPLQVADPVAVGVHE